MYDIYTINPETGKREEIKKGAKTAMHFSPKGSFTYWYSRPDSAWFTYASATGETYQLTTPQTFEAWDKEVDVPAFPNGYGMDG